MTSPHLLPPLLLLGSNVLMTFAWYGHLKRPAWPLWLAIAVSWGIAFLEYCLAVPANRIGYASGTYTGQQHLVGGRNHFRIDSQLRRNA